jgi:SAM-dependent methyltransferase
MVTILVKTDLPNAASVAAVKSALDEAREIGNWSAEEASDGVVLHIDGEHVTAVEIERLLNQQGVRVVAPAVQPLSPARLGGIRLLPLANLIKTGPVDHGDWVYKWHVGWLQRARIRLGVRLLPKRCRRMLEIGYGSGILMPELNARADELFGIDPHPHSSAVKEKLLAHGIHANLVSAGAESIPHPDHFFDRTIAISSLEFVDDIQAACLELKRVLDPNGRLIVVTPGHSRLLDWGLKLLTGKSAAADYQHRRERLLPTLREHFQIVRWIKYPFLLAHALPVYHALELAPVK